MASTEDLELFQQFLEEKKKQKEYPRSKSVRIGIRQRSGEYARVLSTSPSAATSPQANGPTSAIPPHPIVPPASGELARSPPASSAPPLAPTPTAPTSPVLPPAPPPVEEPLAALSNLSEVPPQPSQLPPSVYRIPTISFSEPQAENKGLPADPMHIPRNSHRKSAVLLGMYFVLIRQTKAAVRCGLSTIAARSKPAGSRK